jgi:cytochrome P450 PksS
MTGLNPIQPVDLTSPAFKANPFPFYATLRQHAPVYALKAFRGQMTWLVTRYDDVAMVLRSEDFAKDMANAKTPEQLRRAPWMPPMFKPLTRSLLFLDPPDHTRLRALVHKAFTPRLVEQMRDEVHTLAHQLLDAALARGGPFDLIESYALPLPITLIGRILGVPAQDNDRFHRWTQAFVTIGAGGIGAMLKVPAIMQLMNYLRRLIRERAHSPQDDLISALVQAREDDDQLTEDEIVAMTFLLLSAGHETTVNLIASGTLALLENPSQWHLLQEDPALIRTGVEELLRFVSPAETATERYARRNVEIAGTTIPRGELVLAVIASANRDESRFPAADTLDMTRQDNKHLAFGQGIHYCVGAPLSRLEGQVAINALIERMPRLRLAVPPEALRWRSSFVLRGLIALPVTPGRERPG